MGAFVRRHPFWVFYVLAVLIPTALWTYAIVLELNAASAGQPSTMAQFREAQAAAREAAPILTAHRDSVITSVLSYNAYPLAWPFIFFPWAPTLMALLTVWIGWGGRGFGALLGAYRPVRGALSARDGAQIYLALFGLVALAASGVVTGSYFFGSPVQQAATFAEFGFASWQTLAAVLVTALLANQGALLEELGWRGFAWPLLLKRLGAPLIAAAALGVAWALWHFPREIPALLMGQQTLVDLALGQAVFIVSCVSMTIVAVYFVNITGGSVIPAIIIHGSLNLFYAALSTGNNGARDSLISASLLVWLTAAALTIIVGGADLGVRRRRALHPKGDPSDIWTEGRG